MLAEQGTVGSYPVPESVQAVIAARLDLLTPPEKQLLHDAAMISGGGGVLGGAAGGA